MIRFQPEQQRVINELDRQTYNRWRDRWVKFHYALARFWKTDVFCLKRQIKRRQFRKGSFILLLPVICTEHILRKRFTHRLLERVCSFQSFIELWSFEDRLLKPRFAIGCRLTP